MGSCIIPLLHWHPPFLKMVGWLWEDFRLFCFVCFAVVFCIAVATPISLLLSNDRLYALRTSMRWMNGWMDDRDDKEHESCR